MKQIMLMILPVMLAACATSGSSDLDGDQGTDTTDTTPPQSTTGDGDGDPTGDGDGDDGCIGCDCSLTGQCADDLWCIAGHCASCPDGQLNCACEGGTTCESGLVCVKSNDVAATICAPTVFGEPCEHLTGLDLPGVLFGTGCVASCFQGDSCEWLECSPIDAFADGFCAWPL